MESLSYNHYQEAKLAGRNLYRCEKCYVIIEIIEMLQTAIDAAHK